MTLKADEKIIIKGLKLKTESLSDYKKRYNISPTQNVLGIFSDNEQNRLGMWFKWGIIISSDKNGSASKELNLFNARAETVSEKPSFKNAFYNKRCLIIADGFFEWAKIGKEKQPYYFTLTDEKPFAFAGLYEEKNIQGAITPCCTVITTEANEVVSPIHNRMPVIIKPSDYDTWLDKSNKDKESLLSLLSPLPAQYMKSRKVSSLVNSSKIDSVDCIL
ncbi:MAG: SOS response-associated peptidase [Proteobacteria bacterium]|nr:SOS response-associated peptidase [Pseudomonadota bacterium]